ncbi:MAG: isoprenylcysteine carboxyl methyltransferase family protein [Hyphomicrobium sp.]|uniref:isoprenylcysteine carboxyl methyltransferase family protein n=1 Tax=Hyphomicrobium sp. TaxID=82 RepID=UPI003D125609
MTLVQAVLLFVSLQRLAELIHARRNEARLRAAGGIEHGAGHYPLVIGLHAAWLAALWIWIPQDAPVVWWALGAYAVAEIFRLWVLVSLGRWWTTRIITLSGAPLVRRGPYRLMRHPNYAAVVAEIALLPLAFGAWQIALVFSLLNALILAWRIPIEARALADRQELV